MEAQTKLQYPQSETVQDTFGKKWKFTPHDPYPKAPLVKDFKCNMESVLKSYPNILLLQAHMDEVDGECRFKVMTDCFENLESDLYLVSFWIFTKDGVYRRDEPFIHNDVDSNSIGWEAFHTFELNEFRTFSKASIN